MRLRVLAFALMTAVAFFSAPPELRRLLDLIINLKTAKVLGLTIPQSLLLRADEVIQ